MKKVFDIKEYAKVRDEAKKHFLANKTGEQDLFRTQSELYKPLIQSTKDFENRLIQNQNELLDQITVPASLPQLEFSTPPTKTIDLDGELLNEPHRENLQKMKLQLPNEVYEKSTIESTLQRISKLNRSLGQYLGSSSKKTEEEKKVYKSQDETLKIYEKKIKALAGTVQFEVRTGEGQKKLVKRLKGRGRPKSNPDVVYYKSPDELIKKLSEYYASKEAGNTGVDNYINSILDELLEIKVINKNDYEQIYKYIF